MNGHFHIRTKIDALRYTRTPLAVIESRTEHVSLNVCSVKKQLESETSTSGCPKTGGPRTRVCELDRRPRSGAARVGMTTGLRSGNADRPPCDAVPSPNDGPAGVDAGWLPHELRA
jgi:hypothetical protein